MSADERDRGGALVRLAALDADDAVLHQVDPADAVQAGDLSDLRDQLPGRKLLAVDRDRQAALEADLQVRGRRRRGLDALRPRERRFGRFGRRILERAALDAAAPQV